MIHITEKQTGKILDYIPLGDFWDDNHHKSLKDTLEYFEFRTFGDKRYSQHLEKMNRIIIPDEDGTFIEFVIFHAIKYRLQSAVVIDVYAPASYLLLKKAKVIKPQRVSEYTASQHLGFALNGTEWRPGIVESDKYRTIDIENHTNPYAYIKRIANEFELEPRFRVETDGNKVVGRYVDLLERVGEWQGREVEFGRDLLGIERKVDDSNVVTALIGLGPERDDGTRLEVFVEDEEALQRWGIPNPQTGELMHLIETYEPESTDQDMTIARLTELTRNELEKRISSVVEYTADVADLEKVPGMENKVIRFGDTIKIKDTGFNPPLYLEARVHTQDRSLSQPEKKKVTLGDYIEYTEEEVHAIWKQLQAEIAKKVSMAEVTEVVYTKPEVDARDDAVRKHADTVSENAKIEAIQIAAEDASEKAKQAEDSAKEYTDGRLENTVAKDIFENTVTDLLNNIMQKVDSTRFEQVESELRGIAEGLQREIEEHADTLEEHGGKITKLETDVDEVEGKINATISELEALGDTVSRHETQIDANAREIALKADKQELDLLSGTVSDISSELSVMAGKIEAKAERSEVEKLESDVLKVSQDVSKLTVDVDGIKTNVSSISQTVSNHGTQISNINSTLTQHANMIASKVEKSEFDSVTNTLGNRISTIEQTADSISLEVRDIKANVYTKSEVDNAIDGIQVGGRNLLRNSGKERISNNENFQSIDYEFAIEPNELLGKTVTFSIEAKTDNGTDRFQFYPRSEGGSWSAVEEFVPTTEYRRYTHTFIFSVEDAKILRIRHYREENTGTLYVRNAKLEIGNKATDWTPAPEDIDAQIDDIEGTLASHSTKIEQNAQQIQLRATKTEVDTLTGRVNTVESTIQQHADMIASKVEKSEFDSVTNSLGNRISTIEQTADSISLEVSNIKANVYTKSEVDSTIDGIQIGGRNLLRNSAEEHVLDSSDYSLLHLEIVDGLQSGEEYTISFEAKTTNGTDNFYISTVKTTGVTYQRILDLVPSDNYARYSYTFVAREGSEDVVRIMINNRISNNPNNTGSLYIKKLKLEKGNKATDWTPAPEDVQGQIDNIQGTLTSHSTKIEQNAQQIQLRATKTEVNTLSGRVSTVESTIKQHANMIESKINAGDARSIFRQEASSFTFEANQINFKGHVFGEDATFKGTIMGGSGTSYTRIQGSLLESRGRHTRTWRGKTSTHDIRLMLQNGYFRARNDSKNWSLYFSDWGISTYADGTGDDDASGYIEFHSDEYSPTGSPSGLTIGSIAGRVGIETDGSRIYLNPNGADVFVANKNDRFYNLRVDWLYANAIRQHPDGQGGPGIHLYLGVSQTLGGEVRVTNLEMATGDTIRYRPIRAGEFLQGSSIKFKTNIRDLENIGLETVRDLKVVKYNLKSDIEHGRIEEKIGFISEYNEAIATSDKEAIDLYKLSAYNTKAIQELDDEQQELKGRIAWLEAENKLLREKIKKLEGMMS